MNEVNTVVVGAGQAGLAVSRLLAEHGVSHVVFERGRVGESWRSQRWDSFALNTPNWCNTLPGASMAEVAARGDFAPRDALVAFFERFVKSYDAPIHTQTPVTHAEVLEGGGFVVTTPSGTTRSQNLVVCSGSMSTPNLPGLASELPEGITSLTAATYRSPDATPPGAVVVVGSGQSGCQVVEDLLGSGRTVYLCVSNVGRIPRRYRGRDILEWWDAMGFLDVRAGALEDPNARYAAQPQVSGTRGGHTVSLQSLARDGAILIGRVSSVEGSILKLEPTVDACVRFADEKCDAFKAAIDAYVDAERIDAPVAEPDPYEPAMPDLRGSNMWTSLDLEARGVNTVVWCTGFRGDFSWIGADIVDERGLPRHSDGVAEVPGLYFVGFPWLSRRKSGILYGVVDDATHVVDHLRSR
jgi:putative flavoprotein involved in K+ transport